jgi:hypothetical protein
MQIIPAHSADDHLMGTVREGMRSALFQHQFSAPFGAARSPAGNKRSLSAASVDQARTAENTAAVCAAEVLSTPDEQAKFARYFNITVNGPYHHHPAAGTGPSLHGPHAGAYGAPQAGGLDVDASAPVSGEKAVAGAASSQGGSTKGSAGPPLKIVSWPVHASSL